MVPFGIAVAGGGMLSTVISVKPVAPVPPPRTPANEVLPPGRRRLITLLLVRLTTLPGPKVAPTPLIDGKKPSV